MLERGKMKVKDIKEIVKDLPDDMELWVLDSDGEVNNIIEIHECNEELNTSKVLAVQLALQITAILSPLMKQNAPQALRKRNKQDFLFKKLSWDTEQRI